MRWRGRERSRDASRVQSDRHARRAAAALARAVAWVGLGSGAAAPAQAPAAEPAAAPASDRAAHALHLGQDLLERNDPVEALASFRRAQLVAGDAAGVWPWLGRCHLELGVPGLTLRYVAAAAGHGDPREHAALEVRARLRARDFRGALERAERALAAPGADESSELLAAYASALFRQQRNDEAAAVYRTVLHLDPLHVEAHVRLGSGLTPPRAVTVPDQLRAGVQLARASRWSEAAATIGGVLASSPGHPVAHRLLGEVLLNEHYERSMPAMAPEFARLRAAEPEPRIDEAVAAQFVPEWSALGAERRAAARRALALFHRHLPRLLAMGGRHDLLGELERTTDAPARAGLRGRRTFDGRVWDDVRGMGGLHAATGIESLDEALQFGFDTLAHELAHQAHLYVFSPVQRSRVRALYQAARARGAFLDFYAASNEAEYFGQGVEAFVSLAKRPGREVTHGHTRFELLRLDPALHDFIAEVVDFDPLRDAAVRARLLPAAVAVALRCGRWEDAVTAAGLLDEGAEKQRCTKIAARAVCYGFTR